MMINFIFILLRLGMCLRLIQIKEYRLDRLRDFARSKTGKKWLASRLLEMMLAFLFFPFLYNPIFFSEETWVFLFLFALTLPALRYPKTLIPKMTLRGLLLWGVTAMCLFILAFYTKHHVFWTFFLTPFLLLLVNACFRPVFSFVKQQQLQKAAKKIQSYPSLKRIGITGSFGKSSTKEMLAAILSTQYETVKTPSNINTEIGVAQFINKTAFEKKEMFVVEMGAYREGEIALICDLVHPHIGILTGINEEHVGLFGSLEKTMKAKQELLDALPKDGLALINADNTYCQTIKSRITHVTVLSFSAQGNPNADIYATQVMVTPQSLKAQVHAFGKTFNIHSSLHGKHQLGNLLAAIGVALHLKVPVSKIQEACFTLQNPPHRLEVFHTKKDVTLIDDTYNMNPDGLKAALEYLQLFHAKRRFVVMPAFIELGKESSRIHTLAGEWLKKSCDYCYYLSHDHFEEVHATAGDHVQRVTLTELREKVTQLQAGDVILFCSRGAESIVKTLKS